MSLDIVIMICNFLGPLYMIARIKAKYHPGTYQELHYLSFDLPKWVCEENCQNCYKGAIWSIDNPLRCSFSERLKEYSTVTLSPSLIT